MADAWPSTAAAKRERHRASTAARAAQVSAPRRPCGSACRRTPLSARQSHLATTGIGEAECCQEINFDVGQQDIAVGHRIRVVFVCYPDSAIAHDVIVAALLTSMRE